MLFHDAPKERCNMLSVTYRFPRFAGLTIPLILSSLRVACNVRRVSFGALEIKSAYVPADGSLLFHRCPPIRISIERFLPNMAFLYVSAIKWLEVANGMLKFSPYDDNDVCRTYVPHSWQRFPKRSRLVARKMSSYGVGTSEETRSYATAKNAVIIDLRSDTLTKPSEAMKMAMYNADLGDDVYGEDPTVKKLEKKAADLLGKEAAVFVTSGTMGNLIAIMNHCDVRGSEAYCGEESHTNLHEQGGAAQLGGVTLSTLPNESNGTFDLKKLESKLRSDRLHEPISKLVIVENTINGKVLPQSWIDDLVILAKKRNLKLHMDGARLWNASVASGIPAKDIVSGFDSVTFCLSKGLGAPVGSLLCGSKSFVEKARRIRKVLGGGMRQVGVLAAAGLVAIDEVIPILKDDHRRAASIMTAINEMKSKIFVVDSKTTHTNMVMVTLNGCSGKKFAERLQLVADDDNDDDKAIVKSLALNESLVRFVLYHQINDELLNLAIRKVRHVIKELDPVLNS